MLNSLASVDTVFFPGFSAGCIRMHVAWCGCAGNALGSNRSHKSYRPLAMATFRLNYQHAELWPLPYHAVNVLLHALVRPGGLYPPCIRMQKCPSLERHPSLR
jgi:hypothetical protein